MLYFVLPKTAVYRHAAKFHSHSSVFIGRDGRVLTTIPNFIAFVLCFILTKILFITSMISETTASTIRRLLREGKLSRRKIALQLGVSRSAVRNVEQEFIDNAEGEQFRFPKGPHRRCRSCGARVQLPCLACQVKEWKKNPTPVDDAQ